jgi:toluene monooxygenase electron transfer component
MRVQVNARNRAYEFDAEPGEKILFAGLRANIDLPYECATGTCGTCKARLVEGRLEDLWPEAPGKKHLKAGEGEFLMCQCAAAGNVTAEVSKYVYAMDPGVCMPEPATGKITAVRPLTGDVAALDVDLDSPIDFDAGQYMAMETPGVPGMRGYSMVNFARGARRLEFVIKKKPGGAFSEWLFAGERAGSALTLFGPLGKATFYPNLAKNLLCIAGGSGIAGMMAIVDRACQESYFNQFKGHVFFGVRTAKDAFYLDELSGFQARFPQNLSVTIALSDEDVPESLPAKYPGLAFDRGFVHEVAKKRMAGNYGNIRAYLAGPPPAVDASIRFLLLEAKLAAENIRYDKFS